jgi:hypothetical protein
MHEQSANDCEGDSMVLNEPRSTYKARGPGYGYLCRLAPALMTIRWRHR